MTLAVREYEHGGTVQLIEQALGQGRVKPDDLECVVIGDPITIYDEDGFLRGHGTRVVDGKLIATLCGVVERVNKLIYVRPLKSRYMPEQGDVVVGRVTEVAGKRWHVNLNSRQEAGLLLSAVNLPGGIQRRRNAEDELNMRSLFKEGDLVSAEVQQVMSEGGVALHTRSNKYGKLTGGQLLTVPANLVKRQKQHFVSLTAIGVELILGCNGCIWVSPATNSAAAAADGQGLQVSGEGAEAQGKGAAAAWTLQQIQACTRVANAVRALATLYLSIYPATIMDAYEIAVEHDVPLKDMFETEFLTRVVQSEAVRRHNSGT